MSNAELTFDIVALLLLGFLLLELMAMFYLARWAVQREDATPLKVTAASVVLMALIGVTSWLVISLW